MLDRLADEGTASIPKDEVRAAMDAVRPLMTIGGGQVSHLPRPKRFLKARLNELVVAEGASSKRLATSSGRPCDTCPADRHQRAHASIAALTSSLGIEAVPSSASGPTSDL